MRASTVAWLTLGAGVIGYDLAAEDGELLSHAVDRWLEDHPILTTTVVVVTAAHLLNVLPVWCDPWAALPRLRGIRWPR